MIAGDAKMARDVVEKFTVIARREGRLSASQAQQFVDDLREDGRLVEDIWGLQLSHDLAREEMLNEKYNSGASWFSRRSRSFSKKPVKSSAIRQY